MTTIRSWLAPLAVALAVFACGAGVEAAPERSAGPAATVPLSTAQPIPPLALEALVDATVRQAMERDHIAGVTVAIV